MSEKPTYDELAEKVRCLEQQIAELEKGAKADPQGHGPDPFFAGIPAMAHSIDQNGVMTHVSDLWLKKMGYAKNEVIGRQSTAFLTQESRAYAREHILPVFFEHGHVENVPYQFVKKSGEILYVLLSAVSLRHATGRFQRSLAILTDISELKGAEKSLRESEERYRNIFINAPLGIFRSTLEGRFLEVNPAVARILGYETPAAVIRDVYDIGEQVYCDAQERRQMIAELADAKDGLLHRTRRYQRKNGSTFIANVHLRLLHDETGSSGFLEGIVEDVTARVRAEEILEFERTRFSLLLEAFPGFVYLQAPDYTIRYANRYFVEQFGEPGKNRCYEMLWQRNKPCEVCPKSNVLENGQIKVWEWLSAPNGKAYAIYDFPFIDSDGSQLVLEIGLDITARKKAEKDLQQKKQKLQESNIALNVLLENREAEKRALVHALLDEFEKRVFPFHEKLKAVRGKDGRSALLEIIETNTREILGTLEKPISRLYRSLTPMEVQVAELVRGGKSSKEIAALLNLSLRAVAFHRHNIRAKLDIQNVDVNLRAHLNALV